MKKLLLILLVLSLGLAVAGASAEVEVPDEASLREWVHTLWETNRFEGVISRHQSMTIFWEFGDHYYWCYVTADGTCREWNSGEADYIRPDHFGCGAYKDQEGKDEEATCKTFPVKTGCGSD